MVKVTKNADFVTVWQTLVHHNNEHLQRCRLLALRKGEPGESSSKRGIGEVLSPICT